MTRFGNWPIIFGVVVIGTGLGAHLGSDAADRIGNRGAAAVSYASLVPNPGASTADIYGAVANPPGEYDYGTGCIGCRVGGAPVDGRDYVIDATYKASLPDSYEVASIGAQDGYRSEAPEAGYAEADEHLAAIQRYSEYPVEEAQAEVAAPLALAEPAVPAF